MDKSKIHSYKRRLKALLAGVIVLIVWGVVIECNDYIMMAVNDRTIGRSDNTKTYTYVEAYWEDVQYVYDQEMYEDESEVYQEAQPGSKSITVMSVYEGGEFQEEKIIDTEILAEATPEIVYVGTKERPKYIVPVEESYITSYFGPRWGSTHHGVDFGVVTGTEVFAARDGVVIQTGWNGDLGISVYVEHQDGEITRYAHLSESIVELGQEVSQGEVIAYSGNTGYSTGPHLHFEIRINGEAVDPLNYLEDY